MIVLIEMITFVKKSRNLAKEIFSQKIKMCELCDFSFCVHFSSASQNVNKGNLKWRNRLLIKEIVWGDGNEFFMVWRFSTIQSVRISLFCHKVRVFYLINTLILQSSMDYTDSWLGCVFQIIGSFTVFLLMSNGRLKNNYSSAFLVGNYKLEIGRACYQKRYKGARGVILLSRHKP